VPALGRCPFGIANAVGQDLGVQRQRERASDKEAAKAFPGPLPDATKVLKFPPVPTRDRHLRDDTSLGWSLPAGSPRVIRRLHLVSQRPELDAGLTLHQQLPRRQASADAYERKTARRGHSPSLTPRSVDAVLCLSSLAGARPLDRQRCRTRQQTADRPSRSMVREVRPTGVRTPSWNRSRMLRHRPIDGLSVEPRLPPHVDDQRARHRQAAELAIGRFELLRRL
jgi:hypothetical protein